MQASEAPLQQQQPPVTAQTHVNREPVPRFDAREAVSQGAGHPAWEFLAKEGYVVLAECFSTEDCAKAHELLWTFLEGRGVLREDPETWGGRDWPGNPSTGIVSRGGFQHSEFCWHARENPIVRKAFAELYEGAQEEEMITSYDGGCVFRPWQYDPEWKTDGGWFHVDQNTHTGKVGRCCVQGIATFTEANAASGGLCVVPGSHLHHERVCQDHGVGRGDFVPIAATDPLLQQPSQLVTGKTGDLLLWDSRTIHCNTPGVGGEPTERPELLRVVAYVCMLPRSHADSSQIQQRQRAYNQRVGSSHWPAPVALSAQLLPGGPLTEKDRAALQLMQEAEMAEGDGDPETAVRLYRKASKMSPVAEALLNAGGDEEEEELDAYDNSWMEELSVVRRRLIGETSPPIKDST